MTPTVEQLEDRCVMNAALDLGTIGPRIDYGPAIEVQWGDPVPLVTMPPPGGYATSGVAYLEHFEYWSISAALTQADVWHGEWPTLVGSGEWTVFHSVIPQDDINYEFASMQRFSLPHAESVGLALDGGTVTVYQVAFGSLWSTSTTDAGLTWGTWQQVASLTPQNISTQPPSLAPFGWLADFDRYELGPDLNGDGWPDAPGTEHAAIVYGTILAHDGVVAVGWELDGHRYATVLSAGSRTDHEVLDGLFSEGAWRNETDLWGF